MKRALAILLGLLSAVVAVLSIGAGGHAGDYLVRAVFDNGAFVVDGEDVRIAGGNVGSVQSVDVAMPNELVSERDGRLQPDPGKAIVVLKIDDPGFQDFRQDASCLIRAQALIGEKYVDCRPTLPRAPGSPAPPPLQRIPDGQPGAGQYLLSLERNGKTVDPDLVSDTLRQPYAERFRLLLNGLGAGFAARGQDLAEIIRRSDPALRDTDRVLAILAAQRNQLARLADDSDRILAPLARERTHVAGFIDGAAATATATAERGPQLEAALARFPGFLRELRSTMGSLQGFSQGAEPVFADFNRAANNLTVATRKLAPFLGNSTTALGRLGTAGISAGPDLAAAQPVIEQVKSLGQTGRRPLTNGAGLLSSFQQHKGMENLMDLIYNTTASVNGFDSYGHYLRSIVVATNCVDYTIQRFTGCDAQFQGGGQPHKRKKKKGRKSATPAAARISLPRLSTSPSSTSGTATGAAAPSATAPQPAPGQVGGILDFLLGS